MELFATDTDTICTIELRNWDGENWSPDCFSDLETNFPMLHKERVPGSGEIVATADEIEALIDWWDTEVLAASADPEYCGEGLSADGLQWELFVTAAEE